MSYDDVFSLFKRFDIVLGSSDDISEINISNEEWRDLR